MTEPLTTNGPTGTSGLLLAIGRAAEQASYGIAMLVVAARLEVAEFGPIAMLFLLNSVGLTLADVGVAHDLLRVPRGETYSASAVRTLRTGNMALAVAATGVGVLIGGNPGALVLFGGLIWWSAGEAYVRHSAALREGRAGRIARAELVAAAAFMLAIVLDVWPWSWLYVAGVALVAHHVLVALQLPIPPATLGPSPRGSRPFGFAANHGLAYVTRNVDYLMAGPLLGTVPFSSYTLGFRVASAPSAPLGAVALRWGLARFASEVPERLESTQRRATTAMAFLGAGGAAITLVVAAVLPTLIGDRWRSAALCAAILALALPWRMIDGLIGALGFTVGEEALLVRIEVARLAITGAGLGFGALFGLAGFVAAAVVTHVNLAAFRYRAVCQRAAVRPVAAMLVGAPVISVLAVLLSAALLAGGS